MYKNSKQNLSLLLIFSLSIALLAVGVVFSDKVLFAALLFLVFALLLKAKISFFSIKTIILFYIMIPLTTQEFFGFSSGVLEIEKYELQYRSLVLALYCYLLINFIFISKTDILQYESRLICHGIHLSNFAVSLLAVFGVVFIIVQYPTFRVFSSTSLSTMQKSLLPGNAWNHVSIVCLIFCLPYFRSRKIVKFSYLFVIIWCLVHYERVDVLGLLVLGTFYYIKTNNLKARDIILIGIFFICLLILLVFLGESRNGRNSFNGLFKKLLVQQTASDIGYIFNLSFDYVSKNGYLYGYTLISYLFELIPGLRHSYDVYSVLNANYFNPGGQFLLSEPIMNFGIIGLIIFSLIELSILYFLLKKSSSIRFIYYCFLTATLFRYSWYGVHYIETACIYIIPIIYIISKKLKGFAKKYNCNVEKGKTFN